MCLLISLYSYMYSQLNIANSYENLSRGPLKLIWPLLVYIQQMFIFIKCGPCPKGHDHVAQGKGDHHKFLHTT
jgi:hypothetical protein